MKNESVTLTLGPMFSALCLFAAVLFALCASAEAQQAKKTPRVAYVNLSTRSANEVRIEAFRQGLRELGYMEGRDIVIEYRSSEGRPDRLALAVAEVVRLKVDVIISGGATVTRAAKQATTTIPIVMAQDPDPVGNGFVASLARPGGNITGLSSQSADLSGKRLELLRETLPDVSRVAVLGTSTNTGNARQLQETESAAAAFNIQLYPLDIIDPGDIEPAFRAARKRQAHAMFVLRGPVLSSARTQLVKVAAKARLPTIYPQSEYVDGGGLMSYGVHSLDLERRAATYVDKILKGAKPAELPVEQPTKFELVINLKAANQIGLTIPPNVLARADRVIR
ncbi:MAG TPA: ABC transporter substrate-binding protein [Candidatus Acidoferrales bacterium]|nr:ABC transporter substrate-binding protein [Candidatus Acidoferrales bacterium]